jgi:enamine deaminase RidA (YjgF/YER057c/UK114 family)
VASVRIHQPPGRPRPSGYSDATSGAGIVAVAGQLAAEDVLARGETFAGQFVSALQRVIEAAASASAGPGDLLLLRIYVTDLVAYREAMPSLAAPYRDLIRGHYPATTLVEVSGLIDPRALVEIEALAVPSA